MKGRLLRLEVTGTSMLPTLVPGDRLLVARSVRTRVGDLVVVADPRDPARLVVKRLVASGPAGACVRGDHPAASTDSRIFGAVAPSSLVGRVVYRYRATGRPLDRGGRPGRYPGSAWLRPASTTS